MTGRLLAGVLCACWTAGSLAGLTPAEERGKRLYRTGESPTQNFVALLGDGTFEAPAATVPCGSCHGNDGKGRPEGGVTPSPVTWEALSRPGGGNVPGGSPRPAYTPHLVKRAITLGLDAAGHPLQSTMPRYKLSAADMADLVAYLQRLGNEPEGGVSETAIRLGTVLQEGPEGEAAKALLTAYFARVNQAGGIYGRRLELRAVVPTGKAEERLAALDRLVDVGGEGGGVLAVIAPHLGGGNAELAQRLETREVPAVGIVTPPPGAGPWRWLFYLGAGLSDQAAALAGFAARSGAEPAGRAAIVAGDEPEATPIVAALAGAWKEHGGEAIEPRRMQAGWDAAVLARELQEAQVETLFFLAPGLGSGVGTGGDPLPLLTAGLRNGWLPRVYTLGTLLDLRFLGTLPASFEHRLFLAFPSLPLASGARALDAIRRLGIEPDRSDAGRQAQLAALAAAALVVETLKKTGREVTREGLVERLEAVRGFETGFTPPLTFSAARRVGARGAYVLGIDLKGKSFVPVAGWVEVR